MKLIRVFLLLIVVLALAACARSPESTVESFYRAVAEGEISEAKGYVSAQMVGMFGEDKLSAGLSQQYEEMLECGGVKKVDVSLNGKGEIRSGSALVTFKGECAPRSEGVKLIKEDGDWKITDSK